MNLNTKTDEKEKILDKKIQLKDHWENKKSIFSLIFYLTKKILFLIFKYFFKIISNPGLLNLFFFIFLIFSIFSNTSLFSGFQENLSDFHFEKVEENSSSEENWKNCLENSSLTEENRNLVEIALTKKNTFNKFFKNSSEKRRMIENMIFYGETGTGKSHTAISIAKNYSSGYFVVSGGSFGRIYVGAGAKRLEELIKLARKIEKNNRNKTAKPVFIIIDEIDSLTLKKESFNNRDSTLINTFLTEIEKIVKEDINIVVIGTTNVHEQIESAAIRSGRFDNKISFRSPQSPEEFNKVFFSAFNSLKKEHKIKIYDEEKYCELPGENAFFFSKQFIGNLSKRDYSQKTIMSVPYVKNLAENFMYRKIKEIGEEVCSINIKITSDDADEFFTSISEKENDRDKLNEMIWPI